MHHLIDLLRNEPGIGLFGYLMAVSEILALLTMPSVLLRRRGQPRAALAWLLAFFALPALGVLIWWAFGRTRLERRQRLREESTQAFVGQYGPPHSESGTPFERLLPQRAVGESIFPTTGNKVDLLFDGASAYPAMEEAIRAAERSVHMQFYIWRNDESGNRFLNLLTEKARAGVTVRVLVDAWGTSGFSRTFRPLIRAGGKAAVFMPTRLYPLRAPRINFVNHRKVLVVDETVAFTGGMNIGDEYARRWHDLMVRIEGPAVRALEHVFLDDWVFATKDEVRHIEHERSPPCGAVACAVIASGPDREAFLQDAYFVLLTRAEHRIWLVTPYFIPNLSLLAALRTAADRGVDVRIMLPSKSDVPLVKWASRSFYPQLLAGGVKIYEYEGEMLHAKALIVDDVISSVGSANVDTRSFRLSFEVGCVFHDRPTTATLVAWFSGLLAEARQISLTEVEQRSTLHKLAESAAHLLSPLL